MEEQKNIFIKIMKLIEKETDMPLLQKDANDWIHESERNANIHAIYFIASNSRNLE